MSTFVNLGLVSLNKRFREIDLILIEAEAHLGTNDELYNILCRSAQVLLSAHFEGYLKDLVKNSLDDINHYSNFKSANFSLKKRFCEHFLSPNSHEKNSKENHGKVQELISVFDSLDTKFKKEYFSYSENKNPKVSVLDKIAEQFGIKSFFKKLQMSKLDLIFSNTNADNILQSEEIKAYLLSSTETYPYTTELNFLEIDNAKSNVDDFWNIFIDGMLKRRHDIAHGKELENVVGHSEIKADRIKMQILIYAFTAFICVQSKPILSPESSAS